MLHLLPAAVSLPRLNVYAQTALVVALTLGGLFARRKKFLLHGVTQSVVVLANLALIALIMFPSFHRQLLPGFFANFKDSHYAIAAAHVVAGSVAWLFAAYIVLAAGTPLVPARLRFRNFKPWMRAALLLWWIAFLLGAGTYYVWYMRAP